MKDLEKPSRVLDAIYNRASVRSFKKQEVERDIIEKLLTAGTLAPSSGNMQPWEFIVVTAKERKKELVHCTYFGYFSKGTNHQYWIADAGAIIVVCTNIKRTKARYGEPGADWSPIDAAAATENILLAATALGLAGCWVGGFNKSKLKKLLKIPSYVKPIGMIPIGYPKGQTERKYRLPLKWVCHSGQYNIPFIEDDEGVK